MNEREVVDKTETPNTVETLSKNFFELGVEPGMVLIVHSSLSSIGWVAGGAPAVVLALEQTVRPYGTLVMPTHTGELSDPSGWTNPPVPADWWEVIRREMPPFDPEMTPTRGMGRIPECFRNQTTVVRSMHPQLSFAAWGERSVEIVTDHELDYALGDTGPLGRLYRLGAWVLLLGVGHDRNTSLHLAEYRADYPAKRDVTRSSPVTVEGHRRWKNYTDIDLDSDDFSEIGRQFEAKNPSIVRSGKVGRAECRLFPMRTCVDFAVHWIERNRRAAS